MLRRQIHILLALFQYFDSFFIRACLIVQRWRISRLLSAVELHELGIEFEKLGLGFVFAPSTWALLFAQVEFLEDLEHQVETLFVHEGRADFVSQFI